MTDTPVPHYDVTPTAVMAAMPGIDFVRKIFGGELPEPPIIHATTTCLVFEIPTAA